MTATTFPTHQAEIWNRALDQQPQGLSPEVAKYFLGLSLAHADEDRVNLLAAKARADTLTPAEAAELDDYRKCLRLMDVIKLRARLALQHTS